MEKMDLKKNFRRFYNPTTRSGEIVEVPGFQFLMIDGMDARPESAEFQQAIQALFSVSYKIKFAVKKKQEIDYAVMPLEGLWWAEDMEDFLSGRKERWRWTLMICQPDFVTTSDVSAAIRQAQSKEPFPALERLRLERFQEGKVAQALYIGPFSGEHDAIMGLHRLIEAQGGTLSGKHHEIYLSDFRKTAPEKLKTVLRQPFLL